MCTKLKAMLIRVKYDAKHLNAILIKYKNAASADICRQTNVTCRPWIMSMSARILFISYFIICNW